MSRRNLANSGVESGKPSPVPVCGRVYCSCCACVRGSGSKTFLRRGWLTAFLDFYGLEDLRVDVLNQLLEQQLKYIQQFSLFHLDFDLLQ